MIVTAIIAMALLAGTAAYACWDDYGWGAMGMGCGMMGPGMGMNGMMGGRMMNREQMKAMMKRMMPGMPPPGIKAEDLPDSASRGAQLMNYYCTQCHDLPSPAMHTAEEWPIVAGRMFARMSMMSGMMGIENQTPAEREEILANLKAHSMKSIAPSALPSPESRGAILFKKTCSQCHALPALSMHTAREWGSVVERMRGNMKVMGRGVINDRQEKEIVGYLSRNARK